MFLDYVSWLLAYYERFPFQVGISAMGVLRPDLMMKCIVPVVMAGIIAVWSPSNP